MDRSDKISAALVAQAKEIANEMLAIETDPEKRKLIEDRLAVYEATAGMLGTSPPVPVDRASREL